MKIAFLPIDNRPVCYQMPKMIAQIDNSIELLMPEIHMLGGLKTYADTEALTNWLDENAQKTDAIILSLDTITWGGLIPSRRSTISLDEIKIKIEKLKKILQNTKAKIYAFSSIMRISNNNINEEYWNLYGEKIFKYSYELHKYGSADTDIPIEIIEDYLATRKRNFELNKIYLEWQKEGLFDTLIFSKDDCAEFGFNVKEAKELERLGGYIKTGADEIPLTLLARALNDTQVTVYPIYSEPEYKNLISNYEDVSIEQSVLGQSELANCTIADSKECSNIILYVNNFKNHQGELVMKRPTEEYSKEWNEPRNNYIIADVRNANGADNKFIDKIFNAGFSTNFLGYAGWNTSANTLGSLICAMKFTLRARQNGTLNNNALKKFIALRLLDDWGYQANVRQSLKSPDIEALTNNMRKYENTIKKVLGTDFSAKYYFPWDRLFEVGIELY